MKLSRFQNPNRDRSGFTLIELLVVIIIIGILAALLIPAIGSAMRRSKEFTIETEMKQMVAALEKFKTDHLYPIDFKDPTIINSFVAKLAPEHRYGDVVNGWYVADLPDPNRLGMTRNPSTIGPDEVLPFMLLEITNNPEFPFGVFWDGSAWQLDPNATQNRYFEFSDERLTDIDNDGWFEYMPPNGPRVPYCFFDSRSYINAVNNGTITVVNLVYQMPGNPDAGLCYPYVDFANNVFEEPEKYQIICAGMDGVYGKGQAANPGTRFSRNDDGALTFPHRDNLVSFRDGRLDAGYVK